MKAFIISFFLVTVFFSISYSQSNYKKTINVTVTNSVTGKPMNETEVTYRGFVGKQTQTTNVEGKVTFEVTLLVTPMNASIELNDGIYLSRKATKIPVTLIETQDVYDVSATFKSSNVGIIVMVIDEDNKPLSTAKVTLQNVDLSQATKYTDGSGSTYLEVTMVDDNKVVHVVVEKEGYKSYRSTVSLNYKNKLTTVSATLKKEEGLQNLEVKVVDDKGFPIGDAAITAVLGLSDVSTGNTDEQSGIANLRIKNSGTYIVKVKHSIFTEPEPQEISIQKYNSKINHLDFQMKRKKGVLRDLVVTVVDDKTFKPLPNIVVKVNGSFATTTSDGKVKFSKVVSLGESAIISAESGEYDKGIQEYVGGGDNWKYVPVSFDQVIIGVKKKGSSEIPYSVQVVDDNNQPVSQAAVSVYSSGQIVYLTGSTDANGIAKMLLNVKDGEVINIKISKEKFKSQERFVTVKIRSRFEDTPLEKFVLLKGKTGRFEFVIQVFDHETNQKLMVAAVVLKNGETELDHSETNGEGEVTLFADESTLKSGQLRIVANAFGYEEKWVNIPFELADTKTEKRYFQVYLSPIYKKTGFLPLTVQVFDDKNNPIEGAAVHVYLNGEIVHGEETNGLGNLNMQINVKDGEILTLEVSLEKYTTQKRDVRVKIINKEKPGRLTEKIILQKPSVQFQFVAEVLDAKTNKPIPKSDVIIKLYNGTAVSEKQSTGYNGKASLYVDEAALNKGQFRMVASAVDYEEKWVDIPTDLIDNKTERRNIQVYLNPKKTVTSYTEKKYGSYTVTPQDWVSTGLTISKGGSFRVTAEGIYTSVSDKYFVGTPAGGGAQHWWSLVAKIGDQRFDVGKSGGGTSTNGGILELGTPRVMNFYDVDRSDLRGEFKVFVYSKDASFKASAEVKTENTSIKTPPLQEKKNETNNNTTISQNLENAKKSLEFLKLLQAGGFPLNRSSDETVAEVRAIVSKYNLVTVKRYYDFEAGLNNIRYYQSSFGNVMPKVKSDYDSFLNSMVSELKIIIEKGQY